MAWTRAALALVVAAAVGIALVSGGHPADPRTPAALPGLPPPFLGTAVVGDGGLTAAIDAYGDVVDLRAPGPAGRALIDTPADRQAAGTVAVGDGIVPRLRIESGRALPFWRAASVRQRYRPGTNVVVVEARFPPGTRARLTYAVAGGVLACHTWASNGARVVLATKDEAAKSRLRCDDGGGGASRGIGRAASADRRWLGRARPLGDGAPGWAEAMYRRSLLTLRALTDRRTGAAVAGARDGWAYVWPRDAGSAALAFAAAGYESEARLVARFLRGLDLAAAARFDGSGAPVPGRAAQGDAAGWVRVATQATGSPWIAIRSGGTPDSRPSLPWRDLADYQEGERGDYLANALAALAPRADVSEFLGRTETKNSDTPLVGLVREADDPGSGLDSAAAWAVRPFPRPALFPAARLTLLRLAADGTRFGIVTGEAWQGGADPWLAPTAWSAWSLAALDERRAALRLVADLRRAATPAGALPERVGVRSGIPRSTTPLAWPHAFAILTLRELWP